MHDASHKTIDRVIKLWRVSVFLCFTVFACAALSATSTQNPTIKKQPDASTLQNHVALIVRCKKLNEDCALKPNKTCDKQLSVCKTEMEKSLKTLIESRG